MKQNVLAIVCLLVAEFSRALAAPPIISNIRASQLSGTKAVEILYDLTDLDGDLIEIAVQVSGDGGLTYSLPATALTGHIGAGVPAGPNRRILWNAGRDWNDQLVTKARVRVSASDNTTPAPPPGMVLVPAGTFQMGDSFNELGMQSLPLHNVRVSGFFMDRYETSKELWESIKAWAVGHGYTFSGRENALAPGHPIQNLSWHDAVKWCNARSEKEGLVPCYHVSNQVWDTATVYRDGSVDIAPTFVNWDASGYRLPTEAEWEKAARGAEFGRRYPWGDSIEGGDANYGASGDPFESSHPVRTTPVGYYDGKQTPAGPNRANGYGLSDMAGNVSEWCWDYFLDTYYGMAEALADPRGPASGTYRIIRGGGFLDGPFALSVANRSLGSPNLGQFQILGPGLRCVRRTP